MPSSLRDVCKPDEYLLGSFVLDSDLFFCCGRSADIELNVGEGTLGMERFRLVEMVLDAVAEEKLSDSDLTADSTSSVFLESFIADLLVGFLFPLEI